MRRVVPNKLEYLKEDIIYSSINNLAIKIRELETPRYMKALEVTEELKMKNYK